MTRDSAPELLALHAVRIVGFADTAALARRFALDPAQTQETLLDAEARGWVGRATFADLSGWSLTESGRAQDERLLAAELDAIGGHDEVRDVHRAFLPLNARLQQACTHWQLRATAGDRLAPNDHTDAAWDDGVLDELATVERGLAPLVDRLARLLTRFDGYAARFARARRRARAGEGRWVDGTDIDSCHRVWFELHEDLIATLGIDRRAALGT
ncbi:transcriptional regulator [Cellulomonas fengjieae]|uniref:Transcriptional regulator n=1 Tax=Cellulomonas fengjieae TaxID=2819978 RepID=A0ABS3SLM8_9CELL|nr:transcriptional regulator [Cellulomonas fengjieae]MBO3086269.1 transcriptional regulator [Cellulomonas fengjieae]QVI65687.1 transcriptional regulator [Cellulomonas fengjieae]